MDDFTLINKLLFSYLTYNKVQKLSSEVKSIFRRRQMKETRWSEEHAQGYGL